MRSKSHRWPAVTMALILWVALVPALALQTQRAQGYVVLPVEKSCDAKTMSCAAVPSSCPMPSSSPAQASHRAVPRCCLCIWMNDLTMEPVVVVAPAPIQPIVRAERSAFISAASRTVPPLVPPPKVA